ncbi:MAG: DUF1697 domain-containing protein [Phycisphaerales bacterium]|nr:DUF1697 domain-containing protein [Hyphomonadaceae bacterium]
MPLQVALLRGVNLGKRQVVMSELRALVEGAGYANVRTLIASGNLILDAKQKGAKLETALEKLMLDGLGLKTNVFVRNAEELDSIIVANPFNAFAQTNPNFLVVSFMRAPVTDAEMDAMKKTALTGEEIRPGERCLYIKFPQGQGPSKLKTPKLTSARNWNTVTKLAAALRGA